MHAMRNGVNIFLSLAIIAMSFSSVGVPRMGRNTPADLESAVLSVQHFVHAAAAPSQFEFSVSEALSSLHVAAGLKHVIRTADATGPSAARAHLFYLLPSAPLPCSPEFSAFASGTRCRYQSSKPLPIIPPPRST